MLKYDIKKDFETPCAKIQYNQFQNHSECFCRNIGFFFSRKDIVYDTKIGPAVNIPVSISDLRHIALRNYISRTKVASSQRSKAFKFIFRRIYVSVN